MTLPPLPDTPYGLFYEAPGSDEDEGWQEFVDAPGYTADQLRAYAQQCVLAERERCAKLCEVRSWFGGAGHPAMDCAAAIRKEPT